MRPLFGAGAAIADLVAVGLTRPGYIDASGDRSDGDMGECSADNFTPRVVDGVAAAVGQLQGQFSPRATILVGHSGGGAVIANLLGRHPNVADGALLVACGCDPVDRRAKWNAEHPDPIFDKPNPSLLPLHYAQALKAHGVDAATTVVPRMKHDMLFSRPTFERFEAIASVLDAWRRNTRGFSGSFGHIR